MMIGTEHQPIHKLIIDHNSFTWAIDENLTINGDVHDVTLSNNIIAEGLSHSVHPKGEHSKGLLVSNWGSARSDANTNITIMRNLLASNRQRNPEVRAGQNIEILNNLSYNYGLSHVVVYVGGGSNGTLKTTINIIGNVFKPGPSSPNHKVPIAIGPMGAGSRIYLADNLWTRMPVDPAGNQYQGMLRWDAGGIAYIVPNTNFGSGATILASKDAAAHVLNHAGTTAFSKNSVDARIIREARSGAGSIIDRTGEVGGMSGTAGSRRAAADTDRDGMPDWFEDRYGFDKTKDDSRGDANGDGFTNIEDYINGIITGFDRSNPR
jgi:pectate lyase